MTDIDTKIATLEGKIDREVAGAIAVEPSMGGVTLADVREVMEMAKMMAVSSFAIPPHLQGQQGACFAICMYALEWRMSPFAVANKSYVVNGRLAFESQLLHAVVEQRAPIRGRVRHEFLGEAETRQCRVYAVLAETGEVLEWVGPPFKDIKIKNSPEWVNNRDKQLYYHASRDFCRIYFPDVILGVYTDQEMEHIGPDNAKDVSPNLLDRLPGRTEGPGFAVDAGEREREEQAAIHAVEAEREAKEAQKAKPSPKNGRKAAKAAPEPETQQEGA